MRNDYNDREDMNAIQRDRLERRRNLRRKSMMTTIVFGVVIVAVIAAIIIAVIALTGGKKDETAPTEPTAVTATIAATQQQATQAPAQPATTAQQGSAQTSSQTFIDPALQNANTQERATDADDSSASSSQENGSYINDDNVYIDRKHQAPENTGSSADFLFNGAVDGDFYWNYDADNGNFVVSCDYDYNNQQYIFHFYGSEPGTSHVTLYASDNGVTVPIDLTVVVDSALNVSVG